MAKRGRTVDYSNYEQHLANRQGRKEQNVTKKKKRLTKEQVNTILAHNTKHPELKRKLLKIYQKNPIRWFEERWGGNPSLFRWTDYDEYNNHEWDGTPMGLLSAWEALSDQQWVGIESATGQGKTYFAMLLTFWFLDVFPHAIVITTSSY